MLFGGGPSSNSFYSATISQTGIVPTGTESLQVQIGNYGDPFIVSLGGQSINMVPLATFAHYTLYGGDVSSFGGHLETLSFTAPPAAVTQPSFLEVDNIQFLTTPVPEPGTLALVAMGAVLLGLLRNGDEWEWHIGTAPRAPSAQNNDIKMKTVAWRIRNGYDLSKPDWRRVRLYAIAMLKNKRHIVPLLPSILCVVFGIVGSCAFAEFGKPVADIFSQVTICLGVTAFCASLGGMIGVMIVNYCIREYLGIAAEIVRAENLNGSVKK